MAIEFSCNQCQTLLRVSDDVAGRQAKCPKCSAVVAVPAPQGGTPAFAPPTTYSATSFSSYETTPRKDAAAEINPYASPAPAPEPPRSYSPIIPGKLDVGRVLSQAWEIYKIQWGMCIVAYLIIWAIGVAFGMATNMVTQIIAMATRDPDAVMIVQVPMFLVQQIFGVWQSLGMAIFMLRVVRGGQPDLTDLFQGHRFLFQGTIAWFLQLLMMLAVLICLVGAPAGFAWLTTHSQDSTILTAVIGGALALAPVMYIVLTYSQFYYLIVDRGLKGMEAMGISRQITHGNKLTLFLLFLVLSIISLSGIIALCVGVFATIPILFVGLAVAYIHLISHENLNTQQTG